MICASICSPTSSPWSRSLSTRLAAARQLVSCLQSGFVARRSLRSAIGAVSVDLRRSHHGRPRCYHSCGNFGSRPVDERNGDFTPTTIWRGLYDTPRVRHNPPIHRMEQGASAMKQMDQWSIWQWALFTNVIAALGIYLGFLSSSVKLPSGTQVYVAVPAVVFLNLIFLVARPRMREARAAGQSAPSAIGVLYRVLTERPLVTALCILQLVGATRSAATTMQILQA